jgi:hypothetical protein
MRGSISVLDPGDLAAPLAATATYDVPGLDAIGGRP